MSLLNIELIKTSRPQLLYLTVSALPPNRKAESTRNPKKSAQRALGTPSPPSCPGLRDSHRTHENFRGCHAGVQIKYRMRPVAVSSSARGTSSSRVRTCRKAPPENLRGTRMDRIAIWNQKILKIQIRMCMYIYIHIYIWTHICIHIYCMYICTYACYVC